jgi:hypothetical protein
MGSRARGSIRGRSDRTARRTGRLLPPMITAPYPDVDLFATKIASDERVPVRLSPEWRCPGRARLTPIRPGHPGTGVS